MPTTSDDQAKTLSFAKEDSEADSRGLLSKESGGAWEALGMAEFPIVTTAIKRPAIDTLDFVEKSTRRGTTLERRWRMVGSSKYGLPRLYDLDLYIALLVLAERHGYEKRLIKTTLHELCKIPGVSRGGETYERFKAGARRLIHTGYSAHGVFWHEGAEQPVELEDWHILAEARLLPAYQDKAVGDGLPPSYILLGEKFLNILRRDTRKKIPLGMWHQLGGGLAKPLFHYLDTVVYNRDRFEIGLKRLGNHIGQTTRYAPSHAQRKIEPHLEQFVDLGFLHSFSFERSRSKTDPVKLIVFPGERARRSRGRAIPVPDVTTAPESASEGRNKRNSRHPETPSAVQLAQRFFEKRHELDDKKPTAPQLKKAQEILDLAGDYETAATAIDLAARAGRKNAAQSEDGKGYPDHLGGVLDGTFIDEAKALHADQTQRKERAAQRERDDQQAAADNEAYQAWLTEKIEALRGTPEYDELYQKQLALADRYQRSSKTSWSEEMVEKSARSWLRAELSKHRFTRAHWRREEQGIDATTSS